MGKKITRYHYIPLLDDENINSQGLDAAGAAIDTATYVVDVPYAVASPVNEEADETSWARAYASGEYVHTDGGDWVLTTSATSIGYDSSTTGGTTGTVTSDAAIDALIDDNVGSVVTAATVDNVITLTGGTSMIYSSEAKALVIAKILGGAVVSQRSGNLYGSSKDVGSIPGKMPALGETGGRVNRVGFKRKEIEGTFEKFGFFDEFTQDSVDFDTDPDLLQHVNREMINGASEMSEDLIQVDLINNAGVIRYAGTATSIATVDATAITFADLLKLHIDLNQNRTPTTTKMMSGTRMIDTRTISGGRIMYIGSELQPLFEAMKDLHNERAFIPVHQYAGNGNTVNGEIGSVGYFRLVVVPEMMNHTGAGASADGNTTHYTTAGKFDVFPMLVIGDGSFTTIGFQTDGKSVKFNINHVKPGKDSADRFDPYGETGFMSIKWWYGFMLLRSERLAIVYSAGTM